MGKKDKNKKKGLGIEKTASKTDKKLLLKQKKLLQKLGEVNINRHIEKFQHRCLLIILNNFRMTLKRLLQHWNRIKLLKQLKS